MIMFRSHSCSNALDILKKDHREIMSKFRLYEKLVDNDKKQELAADICSSLIIHCTCEEELLYPLAEKVIDEALVYVGEIEHSSIRELVANITNGALVDKERDAMVKVLGEYVHTHIKQEENELFPILKSTSPDMVTIGIAILELKQKMAERFRVLREFEEVDTPAVKMN